MTLSSRKYPYPKQNVRYVVNGNNSLASGMVGCWLFNLASNGLFPEVRHPGLTGTIFAGTISPVGAKFGLGIQTGVGSSVLVAHNPLIDNIFNTTNRGGSVLFWTFANSANAGHILDKNNGSSNGWNVAMSGGELILTIYSGGANTVAASVAFPDKQWIQGVVTYNGSGNATYTNVKWYFNGVNVALDAAQSQNGGGGNDDSGDGLLIGNGGALFDHIILWKRQLSAAEIRQIYDTPFCFLAPKRAYVYQGAAAALPGTGWEGVTDMPISFFSKKAALQQQQIFVTSLAKKFRPLIFSVT